MIEQGRRILKLRLVSAGTIRHLRQTYYWEVWMSQTKTIYEIYPQLEPRLIKKGDQKRGSWSTATAPSRSESGVCVMANPGSHGTAKSESGESSRTDVWVILWKQTKWPYFLDIRLPSPFYQTNLKQRLKQCIYRRNNSAL
jgi:hypothetical protein